MNKPKLERCHMTRDVLIGRLEYFANGCYTTPESKDDFLREALAHLRRAPLSDNKALTCEGCMSFGNVIDKTPCFGCKRAVRENDCYRTPEKGVDDEQIL